MNAIGDGDRELAAIAGLIMHCGFRSAHDVAECRSRIASWVASARSSSPTIVPPCITAMRSLMPRISGSSDEIITIASPPPASSLISRWISALAPTSTPCVGSSRISTAGDAASQRASATFCWLPPERFPAGIRARRS